MLHRFRLHSIELEATSIASHQVIGVCRQGISLKYVLLSTVLAHFAVQYGKASVYETRFPYNN